MLNVLLSDGSEFIPRDWLRREVLWASLMMPYKEQLANFTERDTALAQHAGNTNRRDTYAAQEGVEARSSAYFNQGKNIGGIVSAMSMFRAYVHDLGAAEPKKLIGLQAKTVDSVLAALPNRLEAMDDEEIYLACTRQAQLAEIQRGGYGYRQRLTRASKLLSNLAVFETAAWLEDGKQGNETIVIADGGTPRSGGPRVDMLQPIFIDIVESESFASL